MTANYPYNLTYDEIKAMDKTARRELDNTLNTLLDNYMRTREGDWDATYSVYRTLRDIEDAEYYDENIDAFTAWCKEHIYGKARKDIDDATLDFYSDWHKDIYGYRPRGQW